MAQTLYPVGSFGTADVITENGVIVPQTMKHNFILTAAEGGLGSGAFEHMQFETGYQLTDVRASFKVAGGSGATITVEKLTTTQAGGAGTALLQTALVMTGTTSTVLTGTLIATTASLQFAAGDRLGLIYGGTPTGLVGSLSCTLKRI